MYRERDVVADVVVTVCRYPVVVIRCCCLLLDMFFTSTRHLKSYCNPWSKDRLSNTVPLDSKSPSGKICIYRSSTNTGAVKKEGAHHMLLNVQGLLHVSYTECTRS